MDIFAEKCEKLLQCSAKASHIFSAKMAVLFCKQCISKCKSLDVFSFEHLGPEVMMIKAVDNLLRQFQ